MTICGCKIVQLQVFNQPIAIVSYETLIRAHHNYGASSRAAMTCGWPASMPNTGTIVRRIN